MLVLRVPSRVLTTDSHQAIITHSSPVLSWSTFKFIHHQHLCSKMLEDFCAICTVVIFSNWIFPRKLLFVSDLTYNLWIVWSDKLIKGEVESNQCFAVFYCCAEKTCRKNWKIPIGRFATIHSDFRGYRLVVSLLCGTHCVC